MGDKSIAERTRSVIEDSLGVYDQVKDSAKLVDDLGADSLDLVELAMALEQEFTIEVPDDDLDKFSGFTVASLTQYCTERIQADL